MTTKLFICLLLVTVLTTSSVFGACPAEVNIDLSYSAGCKTEKAFNSNGQIVVSNPSQFDTITISPYAPSTYDKYSYLVFTPNVTATYTVTAKLGSDCTSTVTKLITLSRTKVSIPQCTYSYAEFTMDNTDYTQFLISRSFPYSFPPSNQPYLVAPGASKVRITGMSVNPCYVDYVTTAPVSNSVPSITWTLETCDSSDGTVTVANPSSYTSLKIVLQNGTEITPVNGKFTGITIQNRGVNYLILESETCGTEVIPVVLDSTISPIIVATSPLSCSSGDIPKSNYNATISLPGFPDAILSIPPPDLLKATEPSSTQTSFILPYAYESTIQASTKQCKRTLTYYVEPILPPLLLSHSFNQTATCASPFANVTIRNSAQSDLSLQVNRDDPIPIDTVTNSFIASYGNSYRVSSECAPGFYDIIMDRITPRYRVSMDQNNCLAKLVLTIDNYYEFQQPIKIVDAAESGSVFESSNGVFDLWPSTWIIKTLEPNCGKDTLQTYTIDYTDDLDNLNSSLVTLTNVTVPPGVCGQTRQVSYTPVYNGTYVGETKTTSSSGVIQVEFSTKSCYIDGFSRPIQSDPEHPTIQITPAACKYLPATLTISNVSQISHITVDGSIYSPVVNPTLQVGANSLSYLIPSNSKSLSIFVADEDCEPYTTTIDTTPNNPTFDINFVITPQSSDNCGVASGEVKVANPSSFSALTVDGLTMQPTGTFGSKFKSSTFNVVFTSLVCSGSTTINVPTDNNAAIKATVLQSPSCANDVSGVVKYSVGTVPAVTILSSTSGAILNNMLFNLSSTPTSVTLQSANCKWNHDLLLEAASQPVIKPAVSKYPTCRYTQDGTISFTSTGNITLVRPLGTRISYFAYINNTIVWNLEESYTEIPFNFYYGFEQSCQSAMSIPVQITPVERPPYTFVRGDRCSGYNKMVFTADTMARYSLWISESTPDVNGVAYIPSYTTSVEYSWIDMETLCQGGERVDVVFDQDLPSPATISPVECEGNNNGLISIPESQIYHYSLSQPYSTMIMGYKAFPSSVSNGVINFANLIEGTYYINETLLSNPTCFIVHTVNITTSIPTLIVNTTDSCSANNNPTIQTSILPASLTDVVYSVDGETIGSAAQVAAMNTLSAGVHNVTAKINNPKCIRTLSAPFTLAKNVITPTVDSSKCETINISAQGGSSTQYTIALKSGSNVVKSVSDVSSTTFNQVTAVFGGACIAQVDVNYSYGAGCLPQGSKLNTNGQMVVRNPSQFDTITISPYAPSTYDRYGYLVFTPNATDTYTVTAKLGSDCISTATRDISVLHPKVSIPQCTYSYAEFTIDTTVYTEFSSIGSYLYSFPTSSQPYLVAPGAYTVKVDGDSVNDCTVDYVTAAPVSNSVPSIAWTFETCDSSDGTVTVANPSSYISMKILLKNGTEITPVNGKFTGITAQNEGNNYLFLESETCGTEVIPLGLSYTDSDLFVASFPLSCTTGSPNLYYNASLSLPGFPDTSFALSTPDLLLKADAPKTSLILQYARESDIIATSKQCKNTRGYTVQSVPPPLLLSHSFNQTVTCASPFANVTIRNPAEGDLSLQVNRDEPIPIDYHTLSFIASYGNSYRVSSECAPGFYDIILDRVTPSFRVSMDQNNCLAKLVLTIDNYYEFKQPIKIVNGYNEEIFFNSSNGVFDLWPSQWVILTKESNCEMDILQTQTIDYTDDLDDLESELFTLTNVTRSSGTCGHGTRSITYTPVYNGTYVGMYQETAFSGASAYAQFKTNTGCSTGFSVPVPSDPEYLDIQITPAACKYLPAVMIISNFSSSIDHITVDGVHVNTFEMVASKVGANSLTYHIPSGSKNLTVFWGQLGCGSYFTTINNTAPTNPTFDIDFDITPQSTDDCTLASGVIKVTNHAIVSSITIAGTVMDMDDGTFGTTTFGSASYNVDFTSEVCSGSTTLYVPTDNKAAVNAKVLQQPSCTTDYSGVVQYSVTKGLVPTNIPVTITSTTHGTITNNMIFNIPPAQTSTTLQSGYCKWTKDVALAAVGPVITPIVTKYPTCRQTLDGTVSYTSTGNITRVYQLDGGQGDFTYMNNTYIWNSNLNQSLTELSLIFYYGYQESCQSALYIPIHPSAEVRPKFTFVRGDRCSGYNKMVFTADTMARFSLIMKGQSTPDANGVVYLPFHFTAFEYSWIDMETLCEDGEEVEVVFDQDLPSPATISPVVCEGNNNGLVTIPESQIYHYSLSQPYSNIIMGYKAFPSSVSNGAINFANLIEGIYYINETLLSNPTCYVVHTINVTTSIPTLVVNTTDSCSATTNPTIQTSIFPASLTDVVYSVDGETIGSAAQVAAMNTLSAGVHNVTAKINNPKCIRTLSAPFTLAKNVITPTVDSSKCETINISAQGGSSTLYSIALKSGSNVVKSVSDVSSTTFNQVTAGTYQLTISDQSGCSVQSETTVTVCEINSASFLISAMSLVIILVSIFFKVTVISYHNKAMRLLEDYRGPLPNKWLSKRSKDSRFFIDSNDNRTRSHYFFEDFADWRRSRFQGTKNFKLEDFHESLCAGCLPRNSKLNTNGQVVVMNPSQFDTITISPYAPSTYDRYGYLVFTPNATATYTVTAILGNDCVSTASRLITVLHPKVSIPKCTYSYAEFTIDSPDYTEFSRRYSNGAYVFPTSNQPYLVAPGAYTVKVSGESVNDCTVDYVTAAPVSNSVPSISWTLETCDSSDGTVTIDNPSSYTSMKIILANGTEISPVNGKFTGITTHIEGTNYLILQSNACGTEVIQVFQEYTRSHIIAASSPLSCTASSSNLNFNATFSLPGFPDASFALSTLDLLLEASDAPTTSLILQYAQDTTIVATTKQCHDTFTDTIQSIPPPLLLSHSFNQTATCASPFVNVTIRHQSQGDLSLQVNRNKPIPIDTVTNSFVASYGNSYRVSSNCAPGFYDIIMDRITPIYRVSMDQNNCLAKFILTIDNYYEFQQPIKIINAYNEEIFFESSNGVFDLWPSLWAINTQEPNCDMDILETMTIDYSDDLQELNSTLFTLTNITRSSGTCGQTRQISYTPVYNGTYFGEYVDTNGFTGGSIPAHFSTKGCSVEFSYPVPFDSEYPSILITPAACKYLPATLTISNLTVIDFIKVDGVVVNPMPGIADLQDGSINLSYNVPTNSKNLTIYLGNGCEPYVTTIDTTPKNPTFNIDFVITPQSSDNCGLATGEIKVSNPTSFNSLSVDGNVMKTDGTIGAKFITSTLSVLFESEICSGSTTVSVPTDTKASITAKTLQNPSCDNDNSGVVQFNITNSLEAMPITIGGTTHGTISNNMIFNLGTSPTSVTLQYGYCKWNYDLTLSAVTPVVKPTVTKYPRCSNIQDGIISFTSTGNITLFREFDSGQGDFEYINNTLVWSVENQLLTELSLIFYYGYQESCNIVSSVPIQIPQEARPQYKFVRGDGCSGYNKMVFTADSMARFSISVYGGSALDANGVSLIPSYTTFLRYSWVDMETLCDNKEEVNIVFVQDLPSPATISPVVCEGNNNGLISIPESNIYHYSLSQPYSNIIMGYKAFPSSVSNGAINFANLIEGTYYINETLLSNPNCYVVHTINVTTSIPTLIVNTTDSCSANNNPTIQTSIFPASLTDVVYSVDGETIGSAAQVAAMNTLSAGVHNVTAKINSPKCIRTLSAPFTLAKNVITPTVDSSKCETINISAQGGSSTQYTIALKSGSNVVKSVSDVSSTTFNQVTAGTYQLTISDQSGCSVQSETTVTHKSLHVISLFAPSFYLDPIPSTIDLLSQIDTASVKFKQITISNENLKLWVFSKSHSPSLFGVCPSEVDISASYGSNCNLGNKLDGGQLIIKNPSLFDTITISPYAPSTYNDVQQLVFTPNTTDSYTVTAKLGADCVSTANMYITVFQPKVSIPLCTYSYVNFTVNTNVYNLFAASISDPYAFPSSDQPYLVAPGVNTVRISGDSVNECTVDYVTAAPVSNSVPSITWTFDHCEMSDGTVTVANPSSYTSMKIILKNGTEIAPVNGKFTGISSREGGYNYLILESEACGTEVIQVVKDSTNSRIIVVSSPLSCTASSPSEHFNATFSLPGYPDARFAYQYDLLKAAAPPTTSLILPYTQETSILATTKQCQDNVQHTVQPVLPPLLLSHSFNQTATCASPNVKVTIRDSTQTKAELFLQVNRDETISIDSATNSFIASYGNSYRVSSECAPGFYDIIMDRITPIYRVSMDQNNCLAKFILTIDNYYEFQQPIKIFNAHDSNIAFESRNGVFDLWSSQWVIITQETDCIMEGLETMTVNYAESLEALDSSLFTLTNITRSSGTCGQTHQVSYTPVYNGTSIGQTQSASVSYMSFNAKFVNDRCNQNFEASNPFDPHYPSITITKAACKYLPATMTITNLTSVIDYINVDGVFVAPTVISPTIRTYSILSNSKNLSIHFDGDCEPYITSIDTTPTNPTFDIQFEITPQSSSDCSQPNGKLKVTNYASFTSLSVDNEEMQSDGTFGTTFGSYDWPVAFTSEVCNASTTVFVTTDNKVTITLEPLQYPSCSTTDYTGVVKYTVANALNIIPVKIVAPTQGTAVNNMLFGLGTSQTNVGIQSANCYWKKSLVLDFIEPVITPTIAKYPTCGSTVDGTITYTSTVNITSVDQYNSEQGGFNYLNNTIVWNVYNQVPTDISLEFIYGYQQRCKKLVNVTVNPTADARPQYIFVRGDRCSGYNKMVFTADTMARFSISVADGSTPDANGASYIPSYIGNVEWSWIDMETFCMNSEMIDVVFDQDLPSPATISPVVCEGNNNGLISIPESNIYHYSLSQPYSNIIMGYKAFPSSVSNGVINFANLYEGTYYINETLLSNPNCYVVHTVNITTSDPTLIVNTTDSCSANNNPTIQTSISSASLTDIVYSVDGETIGSAAQVAAMNTLSAGVHNVTAKINDPKCPRTLSVPFTLAKNVITPTVDSSKCETINISAQGGSSTLYTIALKSGSNVVKSVSDVSSTTFNQVTAGTYQLTISDQSGCSVQSETTVTACVISSASFLTSAMSLVIVLIISILLN
eukprot:gene12500-14673_t